MNKLLYFLFVLSILVFTKKGISQNSISIFGGINFSDTFFDRSDLGFHKGIYNPHGGVEMEFLLGEKISFNIISQYSTKGFKNNKAIETTIWQYAYVDVIPEIVYNFNPRISCGVGIYSGLEINERIKTGSEKWVKTTKSNIKNRYDYGFELMFKYSFEKLFIKARYLYGLRKHGGEFVTRQLREVNSKYTFEVFGISLGYRIEL